MNTVALQPAREQAAPREYRWTADDFERACESGIFGRDVRLELIQGRVIDRMSESPLHSFLSTSIIECLRASFPLGFLVRGEKPIRIAFDAEPVPDISVVAGRTLDYRDHHPSPEDIVLLVEVAVSSAEYDLGEKALVYAQAGIQEYWVALPEAGEIKVHRAPTPGGYASVTAPGAEETISPMAAQEAALAVRDLPGLQAA